MILFAQSINRCWCLMEKILSRLGIWTHIPDLKEAFKVTFRNPTASHYVLPDFAEFCYANEAIPGNLDAFNMGRWHGRNDVWLRLQEYLNLTNEEIFDIRRGRAVFRQGVQ